RRQLTPVRVKFQRGGRREPFDALRTARDNSRTVRDRDPAPMPIEITRALRADLITLLTPFMEPDMRHVIVEGAFFDDSILTRVNWDGAATVFTSRLIALMKRNGSLDDGEDPVVALLDELRRHGGRELGERIDGLLGNVARDDPSPRVSEPIDTPPDPDAALEYLQTGTEHADALDFEAAIESFTAAIALDSTLAEGYYQRALATYRADVYNDDARSRAIKDLTQAVEHGEGWRGVLYASRLSRMENHLYAAREHASTAVKLMPNSWEAHNALGAALIDPPPDYQTAIQCFTDAIRLAPGRYEPYFNRGLAYAQQGQHKIALANYDRAIELAPSLGVLYVYRGDTYNTLGNQQNAADDYTQATRLGVVIGDVYRKLAAIFLDWERPDDALAWVGFAIKADPSEPENHYIRTQGLELIGEYAHAIQTIDRALSLRPSTPHYLTTKRRLQRKLNETSS
ncbi:MAG: tetratricopeptide repeat protein, partial [Chloroflexota bacterium]